MTELLNPTIRSAIDLEARSGRVIPADVIAGMEALIQSHPSLNGDPLKLLAGAQAIGEARAARSWRRVIARLPA